MAISRSLANQERKDADSSELVHVSHASVINLPFWGRNAKD